MLSDHHACARIDLIEVVEGFPQVLVSWADSTVDEAVFFDILLENSMHIWMVLLREAHELVDFVDVWFPHLFVGVAAPEQMKRGAALQLARWMVAAVLSSQLGSLELIRSPDAT